MFLKNVTEFPKTLTFRLTLWYTLLFGMLSLVVFLFVYASLAWHLRQHEDQDLTSEVKEFKAIYAETGLWGLHTDISREAKASGIRRVFYLMLSPKGEILASSDLTHWGGDKAFAFLSQALPSDQPIFRTLTFSGHHHKIRMLMVPLSDGNVLVVGKSRRDTDTIMERYRETVGTATLVMIFFGVLLGWSLSRRAMAGVQRVTTTATQIRQGDLSRRVPLRNEGIEIDNLARAFNEMLDSIEAVVQELREVTDNIAHDLRSPVTRMRGIAETTLTGNPDLRDFQEMAATMVEESDRLIEMINTMLEITKTSSGVADLTTTEIEMNRLVMDAAEIFMPLAEEKGVVLKTGIPDSPVTVRGDRPRLQRVLSNLLDNAIKYTPQGGGVEISLDTNGREVRVKVADTGIGIAPQKVEKVFERFYRGDESRSTPGSGLGLSLAQAIVNAHGGRIEVESRVGEGSTFTVVLPMENSQDL